MFFFVSFLKNNAGTYHQSYVIHFISHSCSNFSEIIFFSLRNLKTGINQKKISIANTYQICVQKLFSILLKKICKITLMFEYAIHF